MTDEERVEANRQIRELKQQLEAKDSEIADPWAVIDAFTDSTEEN